MSLMLLVRHGENDYVKKGRLAGRLPGVHLNKAGLEQAELLAERLKQFPIKAIYSSPLERTKETAAPIAAALGLTVQERPGLIEVDFGEWQDQRVKRLSRMKMWKIVQNAPSRMRFPGGESFADAQYRICTELDALSRLHPAEDVIACVTHSDPIKLAVAFFLGLPLDAFQRLHISPGSITPILIGESGARLLALNYEFSFSLPKS